MNQTNTTWIPCFVICLLVFCASGNAQTKNSGQKQDDSSKATSNKPNDKESPPEISRQRRTELMGFVKSNHPEIRPLLNSLQRNHPAKFQAALRTLDREVKQLQALQKRAPARYKRSRELWIVRSKIKLFSAQLAFKKTEKEKTALENKIKTLITKQQDLRIEQTTADVAQTKKRLASQQAQLKDLQVNRSNEIRLQFYSISKNAQRILAAQEKAKESRKRQSKKPKSPAADKKPKQADENVESKDK